MKKTTRKLVLHRDTVRTLHTLDIAALNGVGGALLHSSDICAPQVLIKTGDTCAAETGCATAACG